MTPNTECRVAQCLCDVWDSYEDGDFLPEDLLGTMRSVANELNHAGLRGRLQEHNRLSSIRKVSQ